MPCLSTGSTSDRSSAHLHRSSRMKANRFEHSESMGSNAHLWRLQSGRRRLLHDLLLPLPSAHAQASQIRRLVSVCAFTFNLPLFSQILPYSYLSTIHFSLASACCFSLQSRLPLAHPLPLYLYTPSSPSFPQSGRALPCIATSSPLLSKSRQP